LKPGSADAIGATSSCASTSRSRTAPTVAASACASAASAASAGQSITGPNTATAVRSRRSPTRNWCGPSGASPSAAAAALPAIWSRQPRSTLAAADSVVCDGFSATGAARIGAGTASTAGRPCASAWPRAALVRREKRSGPSVNSARATA